VTYLHDNIVESLDSYTREALW